MICIHKLSIDAFSQLCNRNCQTMIHSVYYEKEFEAFDLILTADTGVSTLSESETLLKQGSKSISFKHGEYLDITIS